MKARAVERVLTAYTGRIVINQSELAKAFGKSRTWARELTKELEPVSSGRAKSYLIVDVAEILAERGA